LPASQAFDPQEMPEVQTEGDGYGVAKTSLAACLIAVFALGTVRAQPPTKASKSLEIMMKSTQDELI